MANNRYFYLINKLRSLGINSGSVVDCGCGEGNGSQYLIENGFDVHPFDISDKAILKCNEKNVEAKKGDIINLPLEDNFADIFICSETLEHLSRDQSLKASKEIKRICKDSGIICVTVPEDRNICLRGKDHKQYLSRKDLISHFTPLEVIFNGTFCKKVNKCNIVMFFRG